MDSHPTSTPPEQLLDDGLAQYLPHLVVIDGCLYIDHGDGLVTPLAVDHVPDLDPLYVARDDLDRVIIDAIQRSRRLLLVGDAGSGKSSAVEQIAARLGYPLRRVNLNGETGVSELVGQYLVKEKSTVYLEGVLPQAMRRGQILLLDEIDAAQPEVLFVLQAVLEGKPLLLTDTGETIAPHRDFRLIATANCVANESGLYAGTRVQNAATLDRFDLVLRVDYPSPAEEAVLVERRSGVIASLAKRLVAVFTDLREAVGRGDLAGPFSTRRLVAFADTYQRFQDQHLARRLTLGDRLPPNERIVVDEIVRRHLGTDPVIAEAPHDP